MMPIDFLELLEDVPEKYIQEAHEPMKKVSRTPILLAAIIALLTILTACNVFAAKDWFQAYFHLSETPQSEGQIQYLNKHVKDGHQSQTLDGYTIEVVSTLSDEQTGYVILRFTAPEGVNLEQLGFMPLATLCVYPENIPFPDPTKPMPKGQPSLEMRYLEEGAYPSNTLVIMLKIVPSVQKGQALTPLTSVRWTIWFDNLVGCVRDTSYEQELRKNKYPGIENPDFTQEEWDRINPLTYLAKGRWSLMVDFSESASDSIELLSEPMKTTCDVVRWGENETYDDAVTTQESVTVTSFVLNPLGAAVKVDPRTIGEGNLGFIGIDKNTAEKQGIYAVLKNGNRIKLQAVGGGSYYKGILMLEAQSPILLDQVQYVLLADGTQLPTVPFDSRGAS